MSDTVGFISELPTTLVAAFRATLEEVLEADIIVHVRDASHPDTDIQKTDVEAVLGELGVDITDDTSMENKEITPVIEALNKVDLLSGEESEALTAVQMRSDMIVSLSGLTGKGCDGLIHTLDQLLSRGNQEVKILVPYDDGQTPAWLHANAKILHEKHEEKGTVYHFSVDPVAWGKFSKGKNFAVS